MIRLRGWKIQICAIAIEEWRSLQRKWGHIQRTPRTVRDPIVDAQSGNGRERQKSEQDGWCLPSQQELGGQESPVWQSQQVSLQRSATGSRRNSRGGPPERQTTTRAEGQSAKAIAHQYSLTSWPTEKKKQHVAGRKELGKMGGSNKGQRTKAGL